jgi:hypothetical protein
LVVMVHQSTVVQTIVLPLLASLSALSAQGAAAARRDRLFSFGQSHAEILLALSDITSVVGDATSGAASVFGSATSIADGVFETVTCERNHLFQFRTSFLLVAHPKEPHS